MTNIDYNQEINDKDRKFKNSDIVRITKQKNTFVKCCTPNLVCYKKVLQLKKLKILCHGHMLLMTLMEKKFLERFRDELIKTNCN